MDCKEWCGDSMITLDALSQLVKVLQAKYGTEAMVEFDAGANNVQVLIYPTKEIE